MIKPCYFVQEIENLVKEIAIQLELRLRNEEDNKIIIDEDEEIILSFAFGDVYVRKLYIGKDIEDDEDDDNVVLIDVEDKCGTYTYKVTDIALSELIDLYKIIYEQ